MTSASPAKPCPLDTLENSSRVARPMPLTVVKATIATKLIGVECRSTHKKAVHV